jgi:phage protein D
VDEKAILGTIHELVAEEHALRARVQAGQLSTDEEHARLRQVEESLDQCWDLLRRRRAAKEFGTNPDEVAPRPVNEVEEYLQ